MKLANLTPVLAIVACFILAACLWLIQKNADGKIVEMKDEAIKSLQESAQSKDEQIAKNKTALETQDSEIQSLKDSLQSKQDILTKNDALLASKNETIKSLQDSIQSKDDAIAKDNDIIASYEQQIADLTRRRPFIPNNTVLVGPVHQDNDDTGEKIYPADNGFDAQDLGTGYNAFQVFGPLYNPNNNSYLPRIPNHTPWKFGPGNSGIAANGSGYLLSGATNGDSDGKKSTTGQAGILEYEGSSISQMVSLPAGTFSVTFDYEGRPQYTPNRIAVFIDDRILFKGMPSNSSNFEQVTTNSVTLDESRKHELKFLALGGSGDDSPYPATFIDNIRINVLHPDKTDPNQRKVDPTNAVKRDVGVPAVVQAAR